MGIDRAMLNIVTARADALRLNTPFPRPIWRVAGRKAPRRPEGAGSGAMRLEGFPAGRAAAVLFLRFGGGKE